MDRLRRFDLTLLLAVVVVALTLSPIVYLIIRAVGGGAEAGAALLNLGTLRIIWQVLILVVAVTVTNVVIAVPLAILTTRTNLWLRSAVSVALILPFAVPSFVLALTFVEIYGARGILQSWLEVLFGVSRLPSVYGFVGAWLVLTMLTYPYVYLFARASLAKADPELESAALTLTGSRVRVFWRVTLSLLRPALLSSAVLVALYVLSDFGAVAVLQYDTFTSIIYQQYTSSLNLSLAANFALVLVGLSLLTVSVGRLGREARYFRTDGTAVRRRVLTQLGWWQVPILLLVVLFVCVVFFSHIGVLVYWVVRGGDLLGSVAALFDELVGSVLVAAGATVLAGVLAVPVAVVTVRAYSLRYVRWLRELATVGFGLPSIVIAVAFVFWGANLLGALYQSIWLMVVGYAVAFVFFPVSAIRVSLLQVNPRVANMAALVEGRLLQKTVKIWLPSVLPGVLTGAVFVFLYAMKEVPLALVLSPAGYSTLAGAIWANVEDGLYADAAMSCIILVVTGMPLAYLVAKSVRSARV